MRCPAHWDSNWQDIHLKVWSESYEATNLKYEICGDYAGAGTQAGMFKLRLKDAGGSSEHGRFRLVLGTPVDAGWDHSGQNTYYVDVYAEASHYMNFTVAADFYSAGFNVNTLPTSGGATSVVYSSPTVSNITTFNEAKEHSYFANHKIWNDGNHGSASGLDADLLDGQHGSYYRAYANLTGTPTIPSLSGYATESYVGTQISNLVDSSPAALNTLNELAAAIGDDANFSTTVTNNIATKLPLAGGTLTGTLAMGANAITSTGTISSGAITSTGYVKGLNHSVVAGNNNGIGFWDNTTGASGSYAIYMSAHNGTYGGRVTGDTTSDYNMYFKMTAGTNRGFVFKNGSTNVAGIDAAGNGRFTGTITATGGNSGNWNTAYGWGNHASAGYLTSYTETDTLATVTGRGSSTSTALQITAAGRTLYNSNSHAYIQVGPNGGGAAGTFGAHRLTTSSGLDYTTYIGYDSYYSDTTQKWHALRSNLGRKWKVNFGGYHQNKFTIGTYDGGGTSGSSLTAGWLEADWTERFTVDASGGNGVKVLGNTVWHAGNDGSGSGLDADLLDGQHGSYYAPASHVHSYLPLAGGTITGNLNVNGTTTLGNGNADQTHINDTLYLGATDSGDSHFYFGENSSNWYGDHWYWDSGYEVERYSRYAGTDSLIEKHDTRYTHKVQTNRAYERLGHATGYQIGSYNSVAANSTKTNPIYTIGDSYRPSDTSVSGMYGIGYAHSNLWGTGSGKTSGWGQYVVEAGAYTQIFSVGGTWSLGEFNRNGNKVWDAGNDGSGSGLDADMVDGKHKDFLMHYKGIVSGNWDTIFSQTDGHMGVYEVQSINTTDTNYPTGAYTFGGVMSWQLDNSTFKLYAPHTGQLHYQTGWNNDEYSGWRKIWDTVNDGSGSGLDADLLDGQHGSYYANESARKSVPSSGNYQITNSTAPATLGNGYLRHDFLNSAGPPGSSYRSVLSISSYTSGSQWTQLSFNYNQGMNTPIYFRQNQYNGSTWSSWHQLWDSINDGSGSGLDADLLDGQHGSYYYSSANPPPTYTKYLRSDVADSATGRITFNGNATNNHDTIATASGSQGGLEVQNSGAGNDAFMAFHAGGDYALYFGLDADTNKLAVGGWSMGAVKHAIYHEGNKPSLAALGYTGATNANYITNNNQLTNGSGYQTTSGTVAQSHYVSGNAFATTGSPGSVLEYSTSVRGHSDTKIAPSTDWHNSIRMGHGNPYSYYSNTIAIRMTGSGPGDLYTQTIGGGNVSSAWSKHWSARNDGAGSGLDADLLDGQHGSYYAPASSIPSVGNGTLTVTTSGSASGGGTFTANQSGNTTINISATDTNTTYNFGGSTFTSRNSGNSIVIDSVTTNMVGYVTGSTAAGYADGAGFSAAYSSSWVGQLFVDFRTGKLSTRGKSSGTWQAHRFMWDNLNDGSGSGLDADLLDGLDSSQFMRDDGWNSSPGQDANTQTGMRSDFTYSNNAPNTGELIRFGAGNYSTQFNTTYSSTSNFHFRTRNGDNATWGSWAKMWHSLSDGSGSGLDADLLDGQQGSYYYAASNPNGYITSSGSAGSVSGITSNRIVYGGSARKSTQVSAFAGVNEVSGFYFGNNVSGAPTTDWMNYLHIAGNSWSSSNNYSFQLTHAFHSDNLWVSRTTNGSQSTARKIWDSASDGAGSGLDADLLDGQQGSYYNFRLGGTTSGTITLGTQLALVANNYGRGLFGVYSSQRYQHVWSMGTAYKTNDSGTSYGNMYGLTYTHTNVGTGTNQSISGLSHQLQHRQNGVLNCAFGAGIWTSGNVTAYSDIAVKTNLVRIPNALEKVCSINGYTYERTDYVKDLEDPEAPDVLRQAGVVAQEIEKVLPEVVSGKDGNKAVAYGNIVALLIESIKELKDEVDELKKQLKER